MNDYHFEYSGKVVIAADTYEEAEKLLKNMMWDVRGVYNYQMINSSVSVPDYEERRMTKLTALDLYILTDTIIHSLQFGSSWSGVATKEARDGMLNKLQKIMSEMEDNLSVETQND